MVAKFVGWHRSQRKYYTSGALQKKTGLDIRRAQYSGSIEEAPG